MEAQEAAKAEVGACDTEIANIKTLLKELPPSSQDKALPNQLTVRVLKIEGLPDDEASPPQVTLQLSSPVEEAVLAATWSEGDTSDDSNTAVFNDVETQQATLQVQVASAKSAAQDVQAFATLDALHPQPQYVQTVGVDVLLDDHNTFCVVTLHVTFAPSAKDQREELYERLNAVSRRKAAAVQTLRAAALEASRLTSAPPVGGTTANKKSAAVQAGFLNKKTGSAAPVTWWQRHFGPNSILRMWMPIATNYVLFFGISTLMHFHGQQLALPAPV